MGHGGSVPDYMIYLQTDDFSGCPKVIFMYGTDECLFAVAPPFEEAMKRYGADYGMIIGGLPEAPQCDARLREKSSLTDV